MKPAVPIGEPVRTYVYTDEAGTPIHEVLRYEPKTFRQRHVDEHGSYAWGLGGVSRVPYNLPAIVKARDRRRAVVVVEGEKDCDALADHGFTASTNCGGAAWKWTPEFVEHFRGIRRIVVIPDADEPGRRAAHERAAMLTSVCDDVRILDLAPERTDGFDVSDWLAAGGAADELRKRLNAAPMFEKSARPPGPARPDRPAPLTDGIISLDELLNTEVEDTDWLVEGLIPAGGIALLSAKPKVGKSVLAQNLALAIARGGEFLGRRCRQGPVLYLAMEERRETIADRLRALGADASLPIHLRVGRADADAMAWLADAAAKVRPAIVIVDTLVRLIRLEDIERYGATSNALEPLLALSREHGIAQLWLHHNNKSGDSTNSVSGSNAIVAAVDTTIIMRRSEDGTRSAFSEQRIGEDMEETILRMDGDTFAISAAGSRTIAEQRAAEARILELLAEPMTREDIAKLPGCRLYVGRRAAAALIADGLLKLVSGNGQRGNPRLYARSASPDLADEETKIQEKGSSPGPVKGPDLGMQSAFVRPEAGTKVDEADGGMRTAFIRPEVGDERDERDEETPRFGFAV